MGKFDGIQKTEKNDSVIIESSIKPEGEEKSIIYKIHIVRNDITNEKVDAITNAANE